MTEREVLMKRIQVCDFILYDTALFLDTHPEDQIALAYYQKYLTLRKQAAEDFTSQFGPLTTHDFDGGDRWQWVDLPWPWQMEEV